MTKAARSHERGVDVRAERSWSLLSFCIADLVQQINIDCLRSSTTTQRSRRPRRRGAGESSHWSR
jgi:hypothetical protein